MLAGDSPAAVIRRAWRALIALALVLLGGWLGYLQLGFTPLDAIYQTVTTVTTVGFREVQPLTSTGKAFTIVLILVGVGTALYALGVLFGAMVEGHLTRHLEGRRMTRQITRMSGHVIICGWGRVGRACADRLTTDGAAVVIVDHDAERLAGAHYPTVLGDISDDAVLHEAGVARARALVAALDTDADNVYVTLSARALRPDMVIVARARSEESVPKLRRAGADHVVNPQLIGGLRMAAHAFGTEHPHRVPQTRP